MRGTYGRGTVRTLNFRRAWNRARPHLAAPEVRRLLDAGMLDLCRFLNSRRAAGTPRVTYRPGRTAPARLGLGHLIGQRVRNDSTCLSWYTVVAGCHFVAPFTWGLVRRMYPAVEWEVVRGKYHTVVATKDRTMVADLLMHRHWTGRQSLLFAGAVRPCNKSEREFLRRVTSGADLRVLRRRG